MLQNRAAAGLPHGVVNRWRIVRSPQLTTALFILAQIAMTAQTPSPSPAPAGKPLRRLEYTFHVSMQGLHDYQFNGIGGGIETSSGAGSAASSDGGDGVMYVDVLSIAPDGALVVRISEFVHLEERPRQAYTCTVYGSTTVICPSVPAPSQAEWVLLSYLGRQFVDAAPWDSNNHWARHVDGALFNLQEDFNATDSGDGKHVVITETKTEHVHNGGFSNQTEDIRITYDRSLERPDAIHDDLVASGGNGSFHASYDFTIDADSFAKH